MNGHPDSEKHSERMLTLAAMQPVSLPAESLDRVVGGMFGEGETAPDGHELGCLLSWHGNDWQEEHKVYCHKESLCDHHFYVCLVTSNKSHNLYMDS